MGGGCKKGTVYSSWGEEWGVTDGSPVKRSPRPGPSMLWGEDVNSWLLLYWMGLGSNDSPRPSQQSPSKNRYDLFLHELPLIVWLPVAQRQAVRELPGLVIGTCGTMKWLPVKRGKLVTAALCPLTQVPWGVSWLALRFFKGLGACPPILFLASLKGGLVALSRKKICNTLQSPFNFLSTLS